MGSEMCIRDSSSHIFAALNIIEGGCKGLHKELTGDDGKIDRQKVLKLCPSWKKPMEEGIPCTVFRRELEESCPELPAFLSNAMNQNCTDYVCLEGSDDEEKQECMPYCRVCMPDPASDDSAESARQTRKKRRLQ